MVCIDSLEATGIRLFGERSREFFFVARADVSATLAAFETNLQKLSAKGDWVEMAAIRPPPFLVQVDSIHEQASSPLKCIAELSCGKAAGKLIEASALVGTGSAGAYIIRRVNILNSLPSLYVKKRDFIIFWVFVRAIAGRLQLRFASNWKATEAFAIKQRALVRTCKRTHSIERATRNDCRREVSTGAW